MCGRFFVDDNDLPLIPQVEEKKNVRGRLVPQMKAGGEIFPGDVVPVLADDRKLEPALFAMRWGYSVGGKLIINARSETAAEKPLFREDLKRRRCLIPATAYFEWGREDKKKYRIAPAGGGGLYLAALCRVENQLPVFTVLTREPAANIAFIHERMPLILRGSAVSAWLDLTRDPRELLDLACPDVTYQAAE